MDKHFNGSPCRKCNTTLRYIRNKECVACARARYTPKKSRKPTLEGTYYERNRDKCLSSVRQYQAKKPEYFLWMNAKHRAKRRGQEFTLTLEDIHIPDKCPVFGTPLLQPSIDRKDNNKGYTKNNIRIISKRANRLKSDATVEELEAILRYMKSN